MRVVFRGDYAFMWGFTTSVRQCTIRIGNSGSVPRFCFDVHTLSIDAFREDLSEEEPLTEAEKRTGSLMLIAAAQQAATAGYIPVEVEFTI